MKDRKWMRRALSLLVVVGFGVGFAGATEESEASEAIEESEASEESEESKDDVSESTKDESSAKTIVFWSNVIHHRPEKERTIPLSDPKYSNFQSSSVLAVGLQPSNSPFVRVSHRGRRLYREVRLKELKGYNQVVAEVGVAPIPMSGSEPVKFHDPEARIGSVTLVPEVGPQVELVRFATGFGHPTEHKVDLTHFASAFEGDAPKTFSVHVDSSAVVSFYVSLSLVRRIAQSNEPFRPVLPPSTWVFSLLNETRVDSKTLEEGPLAMGVELPKGIELVELHYRASGHGNNPNGAAEFKGRIHNTQLNKKWRLLQFVPWRVDGNNFRDANPNAPKWTHQKETFIWASDLPRSGWVPGDVVVPKVVRIPKPMFDDKTNLFEFDIEGLGSARTSAFANAEHWWVSAVLVGYGKDALPEPTPKEPPTDENNNKETEGDSESTEQEQDSAPGEVEDEPDDEPKSDLEGDSEGDSELVPEPESEPEESDESDNIEEDETEPDP